MKKTELGLVICEKCDAVYYKKSWHHNLRNYKDLKENLSVKFSFCPACEMIKNRQFEGEIIIKNTPVKIKSDLINLAKTFSKRAFERDPMDRLIAITQISADSKQIGADNISVNQRNNLRESASLRITTTENQLAVKLAKKIKETFSAKGGSASGGKKAELKITYSPAPSDVVYITLTFDSQHLTNDK